jgi:two-component system phosphate regulon sensor histidine kinase PhoR
LKTDAYLVKNIILQNPNEKFDTLFKNTQKRFTIIDSEGNVLFDSVHGKSIDTSANHQNRPEIIEALKAGEGLSIRNSETTNKEMIYFALKLPPNKIIRVSVISNNVLRHIRISTYIHLILFLLLDLFAFISYRFYLKRSLFDRIYQIKEMLEGGHEIKEVDIKDNVWLLKFWKVIKEWQDNNLKNIKQLKLEKIKLNNIISSVDMEILLIDTYGKVKLKNNSINFIYKKQNIINYKNGIKYPKIIEFINNLITIGNEESQEIYLEDIQKYLLIKGLYMESRKEFLFTLKDITHNKETLEIQKNFITNVGDELKTPLTSIMGYLVALREIDNPIQKNKFLDIIERNAKKIDSILMDFLNLSKIESNRVVNISNVYKENIIKELTNSLGGLIENKKADISFDFQLKGNSLKIDFEKTLLILKNLIENAIIYNNNKPKVKVVVKEEFDKYIFSIKDNGIGISEGDSYKIFDRFYRVDKARTSNVAGTGLGLSIVNELVNLCGGKVDVISNNMGTTFKFTMIK